MVRKTLNLDSSYIRLALRSRSLVGPEAVPPRPGRGFGADAAEVRGERRLNAGPARYRAYRTGLSAFA